MNFGQYPSLKLTQPHIRNLQEVPRAARRIHKMYAPKLVKKRRKPGPLSLRPLGGSNQTFCAGA